MEDLSRRNFLYNAVLGGGLLLTDGFSMARHPAIASPAAPVDSSGDPGVTRYYVSPAGDDGDDGLSKQTAWRTVERVSQHRCKPGDHICFEGGKLFHGPLRLDERHSGNRNRPVVITSYGDGRATIDGHAGDGIQLENVSHLTLQEINTRGLGRKEGNQNGRGIFPRSCRHIVIDRVDTSGYQRAGLEFQGCEGIRITRVHAHDNGYAGISSGPERIDWSRDVYIGYCTAIDNAGHPEILRNHSGNGIVLYRVEGGVVEFCRASNNGWDMPWNGNGPVGIWTAYCRRVTMQFNISHGNKSRPGATDGGGFDIDGGSEECVLQYNYSYDNHGCGILLCTWSENFPIRDNVVRYNITENDGYGTHHAGIFIWDADHHHNTLIHNNVVFNSNGRDAVKAGRGGVGKTTRCVNNIFVLKGEGQFVNFAQEGIFQGNVYWNLDGGGNWDGHTSLETWREKAGQEMLDEKPVGIHADPMLRNPGAGEKLTDPTKLPELFAYMLQPGSPCIDAGLDLRALELDAGRQDFFGNPLPEAGPLTAGAHQPASP